MSELRSFLGMVLYYLRFLPELATTLAPLHQLLKKDVRWRWSIVRAYERCKAGLSSDALLVHYHTAKRDLRLACDASSNVSITPGIMGYQHNFVSQKLTVDISGNMLTLNELSGMEI